MDGIRKLFEEFLPENFWDTDNKKEMFDSSWIQYKEEDWNFYKNLRNNPTTKNPKRLTKFSGAKGKYWNQNEDDTAGGDNIQILAPTKDLVKEANKNDDYNDCSYVLLYHADGKRIIFGGDSHNKTWDYILKNYEDDVTDIDLLIAPHHGRASRRSYKFLKVLNPTLTFFGNADSEYLAYNAWNSRNLPYITNNQANCMIVDTSVTPMKVYVTNKAYAERENPNVAPEQKFGGWFARSVER